MLGEASGETSEFVDFRDLNIASGGVWVGRRLAARTACLFERDTAPETELWSKADLDRDGICSHFITAFSTSLSVGEFNRPCRHSFAEAVPSARRACSVNVGKLPTNPKRTQKTSDDLHTYFILGASEVLPSDNSCS